MCREAHLTAHDGEDLHGLLPSPHLPEDAAPSQPHISTTRQRRNISRAFL